MMGLPKQQSGEAVRKAVADHGLTLRSQCLHTGDNRVTVSNMAREIVAGMRRRVEQGLFGELRRPGKQGS